jgi:anaerobic magnesium-protoporphyrin IX monomethyl ester cyclase
MSTVLLIYPYFRAFPDLSIFRQPPMGLSYVASSLRRDGHDVRLMDCTFMGRAQALQEAVSTGADVVGISCMVSMEQDIFRFARALRGKCRLLVAGGPLATCSPERFVGLFDVVVRGEGESAMREIVHALEAGEDLGAVPGLARGTPQRLVLSEDRPLVKDLDALPFPARDLFPNARYIRQGRRLSGFSVTTVTSTRGCPYACEFCSNVIFGGSYRERSVENVVDEIEEALALGYDGISFTDDVFTMKPARVRCFCQEVLRRGLRFGWECLGRVDAMDEQLAGEMKKAGCKRIFFGIESANDAVLELMNKKITSAQAWNAVHAAHNAGVSVGAFFILFYPGETDDTVLETLRFAASLPLDYLGLSMPYPLPGTALARRVSDRHTREWRPRDRPLVNHVLTFDSDFSEAKMWFGIAKGYAQRAIRRRAGILAPALTKMFERPTDALLRIMR